MMLPKSSSVSCCRPCRRLSSKSGNSFLSGSNPRRLRRYSHWPAKLLTSASRPVVRQHPAHLLFEDGRLLQPALRRKRDELVVGNAAPEKERQPRRQLEVADAVCRAGYGTCGVASPRETRTSGSPGWLAARARCRARTCPRHGRSRKTPASRASSAEETGRRNARRASVVMIFPAHGPSCARRGRRAGEDAPPARRVAGPGRVERARDREALDVRQARVIGRDKRAPQKRLQVVAAAAPKTSAGTSRRRRAGRLWPGRGPAAGLRCRWPRRSRSRARRRTRPRRRWAPDASAGRR